VTHQTLCDPDNGAPALRLSPEFARGYTGLEPVRAITPVSEAIVSVCVRNSSSDGWPSADSRSEANAVGLRSTRSATGRKRPRFLAACARD
jgi:hypothetical protein